MRNLPEIREKSKKGLQNFSNLIHWIGSYILPDSVQGKIIFFILLGSGATLKISPVLRSSVIGGSIQYLDKGATIWGKAVGESLNYVHPHLSKEVKENISLYAPVLSALIIQPANLTFNLLSALLSQQHIKQQQKTHETANSIKILYDRGMNAFKSEELDNFYNAANFFRQCRLLYSSLTQADSLLSFNLTDIYYYEALSYFSIHCYTDPKRKFALELLDELLTINPDYLEAINLRGIICFSLDKVDNAIKDFSKSLELDHTQTDIHIYLNFCQKNYKKAIISSFSHLNTKSSWFNNSIHILFYCRACSFVELSKEPNFNPEYKKDMLAKAISSYEAAERAIPKNPSFDEDRVKILKAAIESLMPLIKLLAENESISVKRLFEKRAARNEITQYHNGQIHNADDEPNNMPPIVNKNHRTKTDLIALAVKYVNILYKMNSAQPINEMRELATLAHSANIKEPNAIRYSLTNLT